MSGGGVDWEQRLQNAEAALLRAKQTCAARETQYEDALKELKEHVGANPGDTDSVTYKMLAGALETAKTAFKNALKQLTQAQGRVNETQTQAGQAQAPQVCCLCT